ncbi:hypothetical protein RBU61_14280 [Tissierella sp. MB52-C2]|uniref:hypothetical protein n=1 Tax=Tissierella sp. MB52-C2 TaxID=3070999 RepID=UPI00280B1C7D|nr:hypothetical protein [Tissierella sp. MB52-C2]WMM24083.1 hypothetical protein RBU61_14280 [Tissierella sp. MB52-C2]
MKEFALYKGEDILSIGTISDIANQLEVRKDTIAYYKTQAYRRKLDKRKKSNNPMILIEIEEDIMEKCFADNGRSCIVLRAKNCKDCKFFKTQKQVEESKKKAMNRINKLDIHTKSNIINLYFEGLCFVGDDAIV